MTGYQLLFHAIMRFSFYKNIYNGTNITALIVHFNKNVSSVLNKLIPGLFQKVKYFVKDQIKHLKLGLLSFTGFVFYTFSMNI